MQATADFDIGPGRMSGALRTVGVSAIYDKQGAFMNKTFGYGRVSTHLQSLDSQLDALLSAGVDRADIHLEKFTGTKASRPVWDHVLDLLRDGDTLVITRLDRLARSRKDLVEISFLLRTVG